MRDLLMLLALLSVTPTARAQPADCAMGPQAFNSAPLPVDVSLAGLPGVPPGVSGQVYLPVPMVPGGMTCTDRRPLPRDILRGEPGDVLHGGKGDLLRGSAR